jgi:hypothetical protein
VQALVFLTVTTLVERLGDYAKPHASTILAWLPAVWHGAQGQGLLRMQARRVVLVSFLGLHLQNVVHGTASAPTHQYSPFQP